ncbi:MAG: SprB repeat-containing protein, partial [Vicingaceae bacterium]
MNANVLINEPTVLTLLLYPDDKICPDACNAEIIAGAGGGTAPYNYVWNDPSGQITANATTLCAGTYTLFVTDSLGCTISDSGTVVNPLPMTLGNITTSSNCNQADGSATASVTANGTAPFTFIWEDGANTVIGNNATLSNVIAGTYYATATDSLGCSVTDPVNITDLSGPSIAVDSIYNVQCFGGADGYAELQVSGGATPYTYLWAPGGSTLPSASNLTAGNYVVLATDSNGCTASLGIVITEPINMTLTAGGTDPSCFSFTDGSVWVNANGGSGGTYNYTWNNPAPASTNDTVYNLASGTYTVTVADSNGCFETIPVVLNNPLLLTVSVTGNNVTCFDVCDGDAIATISNGIGIITYLWDDPSNQTTPNATGLCDTTITLVVTDAMGCTATDALLITQPDLLVLTEDTHGDVSCNGGFDGFSSVNYTGGTGVVNFSWTLAGIPVNTNQAANNLFAGLYNLTATDQNGCNATLSVTISEPNPLTAVSITENADCSGANTGYAVVTVNGGTAPYSYLWQGGTAALQATDTAFNLGADPAYMITITDSLGCIFIINNIAITEPTPIALGVTTTSSTCGTNNGTASVAFGGGTGTPTFVWATI